VTRGGVGQDQCAVLVNDQTVRVLFKNNYSFGTTIFNVYMIYGGTNWGNLGYHGGYTSYDYGAAITEDRQVWRESYSEMRLEATFLKGSPAYLTATPGNVSTDVYTTTKSISVTPLFGNGTKTNFYILRHTDFTSTANTSYSLKVPASIGSVTIPQLWDTLELRGRDSKMIVTDYDVGGINMIYSTADVYTWAKGAGSTRVLVLYGGMDETHEAAFPTSLGMATITDGLGVGLVRLESGWVVHWSSIPERRVVTIGDLEIHLLWRNEAFKYWMIELEAPAPIGNYTSISKSSVLVKAGYLVRTASIVGQELRLTGDVNATTTIEVISAPMSNITTLVFNGQRLNSTRSMTGKLVATVQFDPPKIVLPDFTKLEWKYLDSLPEIQSSYDDSKWTELTRRTTNNTHRLDTPTVMYASDYGYHTGSLIYRGIFVSSGNESQFSVNATGGAGFGHSIWLNETLLGSWPGSGSNQSYNHVLSFPKQLARGKSYVLTVLIDHMGQDEEAPGTDAVKDPRGITSYSLSGHRSSDVQWKMTGNLGGEQYFDLARGPRNEGAMYAERQGYHLPNPPTSQWKISNPVLDGLSKAGVGFYTTTFDLHVPQGYDVPMSFTFNSTATKDGAKFGGPNYRSQLFVNGYQFGKYGSSPVRLYPTLINTNRILIVNNLGPQTAFPVPEGILNYDGKNTVSLTLWAMDAQGARLSGFELVPQKPVLSGYSKPGLSPQPSWVARDNAY
jgi:hypothetical protein